MNSLRDFDFYRKIPRDLTESSTHGAALSLCASIFMLTLFVCELWAFLSVSMETSVVLDPNTEPLVRINFNITGSMTLADSHRVLFHHSPILQTTCILCLNLPMPTLTSFLMTAHRCLYTSPIAYLRFISIPLSFMAICKPFLLLSFLHSSRFRYAVSHFSCRLNSHSLTPLILHRKLHQH